jgi:ribonuclease Z
MNIEVFILGTGGMMPLPGRGLTSVLVRREGELFLFDCGEATQIAFRRLGLRWKKISHIFISHTHADHVTGLPGMLSLSAQVERSEPLHVYGPPRVRAYIEQSLRILDIYIDYEIVIHETFDSGLLVAGDGYEIHACRLRHSKPCLGYTLVEGDRPGEFHPERAVELGVPRGPLWGRLQGGAAVTLDDGRVVESAQVMGAARAGRKFAFITDTAMVDGLDRFVADADLMICEGMFAQDLRDSAHDKKHLTAGQAGALARVGGVRRMGLIHYSPRYTERDLKQLLREARGEFPGSFLTRDLQELSIPFRD